MADAYRIGHGWDIHRLEPTDASDAGAGLRLGGLLIPAPWRLVAHSDGDVALHALTDAILGALGAGDIGDLFPDTAPENHNRDSAEFVAEALRRMRSAGYRVVNADLTITLERPRLAAYKTTMRERIASILDVGVQHISVKAKTAEGLGALGENRAAAAQAVVLLAQAGSPPKKPSPDASAP